MMMKRCQVFAAMGGRRQEKGWLLYLRFLPQGNVFVLYLFCICIVFVLYLSYRLMMMKRCQVFEGMGGRRQEKGWLLYLRSLPRGMTNNSARPLFPKLSRYKQIVIVKLLNFGQFASFIQEQKAEKKTFPLTGKTEKKSSGHWNCHAGPSFLTLYRRLTSSSDAGCCVWHGMCIACYLIIQPCKKSYKGVTRCKKLYKSVNACKNLYKTAEDTSFLLRQDALSFTTEFRIQDWSCKSTA